METTDYVSYPLAVKLKDCGFDEPCREFYNSEKIMGSALEADNFNHLGETYQGEWFTDTISAPLLYHAQKWLRDKKNIVVIAEPDFDCEVEDGTDFLTGKWYFTVWKDGDRIQCNFNPNSEVEEIWMFEKYESALSAGLTAALELLGKEV